MAILEDCNSDLDDVYFPTHRFLQTGIVATTDIKDLNTAFDDGKEKQHQLEEIIFNEEKALKANLKKMKERTLVL